MHALNRIDARRLLACATTLMAFLLCTISSAAEWSARVNDSGPGPMAVLVRNADQSEGRPPFALVDQFGTIQRYVEPTPGIDLASQVGSRVRVNHDTGETLLASQLEFSSTVQPLKTSSTPRAFEADRAQPLQQLATLPNLTATNNTGNTFARYDDEPDTEPIVLEDVLAEEAESLPTPGAEATGSSQGTGSGASAPTSSALIAPEVLPAPSYRSPASSTWIEGQSSAPCDCDQCKSKATRFSGGTSSCEKCAHRNCNGLSCNPASNPGPYGRIEYLLWWFDELDTPPLVTTGPLGPTTSTLYGGSILGDARHGARLTLGWWLDDCRDFAIEADALWFDVESESFSASDITGTQAIARPFYNVGTLAQDARFISSNGWAGTVNVNTQSEFEMFGLRMRTGLACHELGGGRGACPTAVSRVDFISGYRYASLNETLTISENRITTGTVTPDTYTGFDRFEVDNDFHGVDLGFISEWETCNWSLELLGRIGLGVSSQHVTISGSGTVNGAPESASFLALGSNIGTYKRDRFGVLPEISARLAYKISPRLRVGAAYSLLYWANVVRPGEQINLNIDPNLVPPGAAAPALGSLPSFAFHETSFWAHGLSFSLDGTY